MTSPVPWRTLTTPGGMPASWHSWPISVADIGVCSAGLSTTELPHASAATTKLMTKAGPFQGTMMPTTPSGSRVTLTTTSGDVAGIVPLIFDGQPGVVVEAGDGELDDGVGVAAQQAGVERVEVAEHRAVLGEQLGEAAQAPLLLERREVAPPAVLERAAGRADGPLEVLGIAGGDGADLGAGRRARRSASSRPTPTAPARRR